MGKDRKKEIVELCLNLFIEKGLYETSTRDLSKAMNLQNAGLYYYFLIDGIIIFTSGL